MAKKQSLSASLQASLEAHRSGYLRQLAQVKQAQGFLSDRKKLTFQVKITSLWADHGEESVCLKEKGSLRSILVRATEQFKELNKRSDIQGRYTVSVIFPNSYSVDLLPEVWEQFQK